MAAGGAAGAAALGFGTLLASRFFEAWAYILLTVSAVALMNSAAATPRDRAKAPACGAPTCRLAAASRF